jgi:hypothetical protein
MKKITYLIISLIFLLISFSLTSDRESVQDLKKAIEETGKLKFKANIPVKYFNKQGLKKYIEDLFETDYPDELAEKEEHLIRLMGFTGKLKIDLKQERRKILIDNAGGFYNEKTGELFVLEEYRETNDMNAMILVHELRHGIQDQYFDLSVLLNSCTPSDFDDRRLALLAAVEGDATMVMLQYSDFKPEALITDYNADALLSFSPKGNNARVSNAPGIVKHQLIMPYVEGLKFYDYILKRKRWKGVNKVLKSPPVSSEQVLHPEKYLKKESPLRVDIAYRPQDCSLFHSGVIGEYYLNILLLSKNQYEDYAVGWGGDRFEIHKSPSGGSYFLIWESLWDTELFCSNFYHVFKGFFEKTFKINFKDGKMKGKAFIAGISSSGPGADYFFIHKIKNRIFFVRSNDRKQVNTFIDGGNYD